jgi:ABC-type uncharacterized transport system substrate-binding protein
MAASAALAAVSFVAVPEAQAHPHVFVAVKTEVRISNGTINAIKQVWTFDEFYSAMATEGLDTNKDGKLDRQELAELARVNMEGLRDFAYFTHATLQGTALKLAEAEKEAWLEFNNNVLSLHFSVPLEKPVLIDAKGFAFSIYDPSYFIAFELDPKEPARLSAEAPASCKVAVGVPKQDAADAQKLGESFFTQLGGNSDFASGFAKTVSVSCGG